MNARTGNPETHAVELRPFTRHLAPIQGPGQVSETIRDTHAGTLDWRTLLRFITNEPRRT